MVCEKVIEKNVQPFLLHIGIVYSGSKFHFVQ